MDSGGSMGPAQQAVRQLFQAASIPTALKI